MASFCKFCSYMMLHEGQNLDVQQGVTSPARPNRAPFGGPMASLGIARQVSVVPTEATDPEDPPDSVRPLPGAHGPN